MGTGSNTVVSVGNGRRDVRPVSVPVGSKTPVPVPFVAVPVGLVGPVPVGSNVIPVPVGLKGPVGATTLEAVVELAYGAPLVLLEPGNPVPEAPGSVPIGPRLVEPLLTPVGKKRL